MSKVLVIGAGISGLVAGIYARIAGYEVDIYESHSIVGGNCTGWVRKGYHIDGCIQWMTGTKKGTGVHKIWQTCGALTEDTQTYIPEEIASTVYNGTTYHLYTDMEKTEREFLKISPEDKGAIKQLMKDIRRYQNLNAPIDRPFEEMSVFSFFPLIFKMILKGKTKKRIEAMTIKEYLGEFKSPIIRQLLFCVFPSEMPAYALFYCLGIRSSGDGGWPMGGSMALMKRMQQRFETLGGKVHLNALVDKIIVKDGIATGIRLKDDEHEIAADYIIPAVDGEMLHKHFLEGKFQDEYFTIRYAEKQNYLLLTGTYIGLGVQADLSTYPHNVYVCPKEPLRINNTEISAFNVKIFNFEPSFTEAGKTVMAILLTEDEFDYWKELKTRSHEEYKAVKKQIAEWAQDGIIGVYPELEGKFEMSSVATPLTFHRYCHSYRGTYMSFIPYGNVKKQFHKGTIEGIRNLFVAGQSSFPVGGLPLAAITGKFAVQRLIKADKK